MTSLLEGIGNIVESVVQNVENNLSSPPMNLSDRVLFSAIKTTLTVACVLSANTTYDSYNIKEGDRFDYVVIGSGSGGLTTAVRLSEVPNYRVLILEAGRTPPCTTVVPKMFISFFSDFDYEYNISSVYNPNYCQGFNGGVCLMPLGKMFGGSPAHNFMYFFRGQPSNYDDWAQLYSCTGWDWKGVLPYFLKLENNKNQTIVNANPTVHSTTGQLPIAWYDYDPNTEFLWKAGKQGLNVSLVLDMNSGHTCQGYVYAQATLWKGERADPLKFYYAPIRNRSNIKAALQATATKVNFDESMRAISVDVIQNGIKKTVQVNYEVIVSAGAVNTPNLLQKSGIGDPDDLKTRNIKALVEAKQVGRNIRDHFGGYTWFSFNPTKYTLLQQFLDAVNYATTKKGPYATTGTLQLVGWLNSQNDPNQCADLEYYYYYFNMQSVELSIVLSSFNYNKEIVDFLTNENESRDILLKVCSLVKPKCSGTVKLNADGSPRLDMNYFCPEYPSDKESVVNGILLQTSLLNTPAYKAKGGQVLRVPCPKCDNDKSLKFNTRAYWNCALTCISWTVYHPCGSARMGTNITNSVLDPQLRVHGTKCLRVVDSSIPPMIPTCNLNGPTIMIGEKAADLIKADSTCR